MKKLFLMLLTIASTNVLFGVPPRRDNQQRQPQFQEFIVQRAQQTTQNNVPARRNQNVATRPLNRTAITDPRTTSLFNDFQLPTQTRIPTTLPVRQNVTATFLNRPAVAMPVENSQSGDDELNSSDDSDSESDALSSVSQRTENRENNNRTPRAQTPEPMVRFMTDFQARTNNRSHQ